MTLKKDEAVSPVVGVMLMLVVTIIIAAVVSGFAGGLAGETQKAPQISLKAEPVIQAFSDSNTGNGATQNYDPAYPEFTAANGIEFENMGGDTFQLTDIGVVLDAGGTKYTITSSDLLNDPTESGSGNWLVLPDDLTDGGYFLKIGDATKGDKTIAPGDKYMFYADGHYDATGSGWGATSGKYLVWRPAGSSGGIGAQFGTKVGWTIVDRETSKPMASGYVVFR